MNNNNIKKIEIDFKAFKELVDVIGDEDSEIQSLQRMVVEYVNTLEAKVFFDMDAQRVINKFLWETRKQLGFSCMTDALLAFGKENV